MGKNKVLQVGLGRSEQEEFDENLHKVSEQMVGQRGILFTNESVDEILRWGKKFAQNILWPINFVSHSEN